MSNYKYVECTRNEIACEVDDHDESGYDLITCTQTQHKKPVGEFGNYAGDAKFLLIFKWRCNKP